MASVSWIYPQDRLIALRRQNELAEAEAPIDTDVDLLRFRYTINGDTPPWRPLKAFDDGHKAPVRRRGASPRRWCFRATGPHCAS